MSGVFCFGFVRAYLTIGVILLASWPLCAAVLGAGFGPRFSLRLARVIYAAALVLPALALAVPKGELGLRPAVQIFSNAPGGPRAPGPELLLVFSPQAGASARTEWLLGGGALGFLAFAALALIALAVASHLARVAALALRLRRLPVIREVRGVRVLAGEGDPVPYSARVPGMLAIVLPLHLFRDARELRLAAAHELQHHRQGDTAWVHAVALARALFFWNPAAYAWERIFDRLQEVACDAALIGRPRVSPQAYGRCLLRVAETAALHPRRFAPVGTAGMATGIAGSFLRRRIEMIMMKKGITEGSSRKAALAAVCAVLALALMAAASRAEIQDRRLSASAVAGLAENAAPGAGLPIEANDRIVERVNQLLGSPERREKLKSELAAMAPYREMIEGKLAAAGMPAALLALPLFESGFQVNAVSSHSAAGLWQFVPGTARRYGLNVAEPTARGLASSDDRFDPGKETDAAIHYLQDLNLIFGDWRLALTAYNVGEGHLVDMIRDQHTRDPWGLVPSGDAGDYLAGAIAMMIIQRNPSVLD